MSFELRTYEKAHAEGRVTRSASPCGRFVSFKYGRGVPYEQDWDFATLTARGHVWEIDTGRCLGAPFDKFFNMGELSPSREGSMRSDAVLRRFVSRWSPDVIETATPWEKLDGSMGLVWLDTDGRVRINTPGSFASDQAVWAANWLAANSEVRDAFKDLLSGGRWHSLCVEIICRLSKVVVPYSYEGLVLTGASIDPHVYWDAPDADHGDDVWGRWASPDTLKELAALLGIGCAGIVEASSDELVKIARTEGSTGDSVEGWVFQSIEGSRFKLKCADYCELHRQITDVHPNRVKEILEKHKVWYRGADVVGEPEQVEPWEAACIDMRDFIVGIDEEYREDYERFVEGFIAGVRKADVRLRDALKKAHRAGFHNAADYGRATSKGLITPPKGITVGQVCGAFIGKFTIPVKDIFAALRARIFPDL